MHYEWQDLFGFKNLYEHKSNFFSLSDQLNKTSFTSMGYGTEERYLYTTKNVANIEANDRPCVCVQQNYESLC